MNRQKQIASTIAWRLSDLRATSGVKQRSIAGLIGTSQSRMSEYESGETVPSLLSLVKLADTYEVSLDYLTGRTDIARMVKEETIHD
jgi:transcriptional regulator with XRE-family HTH domain